MRDALSSTFIKLLTGGVILYIVMAINIGPGNVLSLIMLSLYCTLGTSLIPWIMIAYIIGFVIDEFLFLHYFRHKSGWNIKIWSIKDNEDKALIQYIREAKKYYLSEDSIRDRLLESGWAKVKIDRALNMV